MATPEDFDPYRVVKDATAGTKKFFTTFGGILPDKSAPAEAPKRPQPKAGEPGDPSRTYKASPEQMKRQEARLKKSAPKSSPKR